MAEKIAENFSFEDSLDALEEIVEAAEDGNISLEKMVQNYERGIKILADCKNKLEVAELQIKEASKIKLSSSSPNA